MPRALPLPLREQIIRRHQQGEALTVIAHDLNVPYRTARRWWHRYQEAGDAGLRTHYDRCGPQGPRAPAAVHAAALALKLEHPPWGAGLIRLKLVAQFGEEPVPQERALQRWFAAAKLQPARTTRPLVPRERGQTGHAVWEMDAKEQMRLADGTGMSVLTVTDEASGALLAVTPFPPVSLVGGRHGRGASGDAESI
jgi:transposase